MSSNASVPQPTEGPKPTNPEPTPAPSNPEKGTSPDPDGDHSEHPRQ